MSKWIRFDLITPRCSGRKTDIWRVAEKDATDQTPDLGEVKWYGAWRKFAFFPFVNTLFEQDCLRDIANFCETETRKHRVSS